MRLWVLTPLVLFGLLLALLWRTSQKEQQRYFKLEQSFNNARVEQGNATQSRTGVRKDFWFNQGQSRQHLLFLAPTSQLQNIQVNGHKEMVEYLQDLQCWMQEELLFKEEGKAQIIRHFQATQGTFFTTRRSFDAEAVTITRLCLPGHALPPFQTTLNDLKDQTLMEGVADHALFQFDSQNQLRVDVDHFKAHIYQKEALDE